MGEFEAQRTWQQVDALYSPVYSEVFAGGAVFEYSAEKRIADSSQQGNPWPYYGFMKLQYGVGYYSPVDCDHTTIECEYNPYPEFDSLRERFAAVDVSYVPNRMDDGNSQVGEIPQCPQGMPILSDFEWPTDDEPDLPCYVVATPPPTASPTTASPTSSPSQSPTNDPSMSPTISPAMQPASSPSKDEDSDSEIPSAGVIPGISSSTYLSLSVATLALVATTSLLSAL